MTRRLAALQAIESPTVVEIEEKLWVAEYLAGSYSRQPGSSEDEAAKSYEECTGGS